MTLSQSRLALGAGLLTKVHKLNASNARVISNHFVFVVSNTHTITLFYLDQNPDIFTHRLGRCCFPYPPARFPRQPRAPCCLGGRRRLPNGERGV